MSTKRTPLRRTMRDSLGRCWRRQHAHPRSVSSDSSDRSELATLTGLSELSEQPSSSSGPDEPESIGGNGAIGTAPPVSSEEVEAALAWAAHQFETDCGLPRPEAEFRALALVRGEFLNDPRLTSAQQNLTRCLVCGAPERLGNPLVPTVTPISDRFLWMHVEACHTEHLQRCAELVDRLLEMAGGNGHEASHA
jgi:hypothetical protein